MSFIVVYDANVLYSAAIRDQYINLARTDLVQAKWTDEILDECFRSIVSNRPDLNEVRPYRTRTMMTQEVPDMMVSGYEELVDGLHLPDVDDRHVLAAAIRSSAAAIVTFNLKAFPDSVLETYDIEAIHPDEFMVLQFELDPKRVEELLISQAAGLRNPPKSVQELKETLSNAGLPKFIKTLNAKTP